MAPPGNSASWKIAFPVISFTTLCVILPFLHYGIPSGHDFEFHMNSWIEVVDHWKQGIIYPHWAAMAHYGYGEARFIFYPPFSWTLGALLGLVLPWKLVPPAYIWLVLTLSGCSMFTLAKRWLPGPGAVWAAAFYAANPYHLVIVYWRSAFAELLAAAYCPLLLMLVLELDENETRVVPALSLLVAAGWLTNVPSAVMITYSLSLLVMWLAVYRRSWKVLLYGFGSLLLGTALAAAYLLPAIHQREWINVSEVLASGVNPVANFLFTVTHDPDHNRFNKIVSVVALWEIVVLAFSLCFAKRKSVPKLWWALVLWGGTWAILMSHWTLPLWNWMPELKYVQFPWRPLLCMNVPVALAIVAGLERWWLRATVCFIAIGSVPVVWARIQPPWWDAFSDIQEMVENQHNGVGNEGVDEYVPAGTDPYEADQKSPLVRFEGRGKARVETEFWGEERKSIAVNSISPGAMVLRLFNYPLWHVTDNGRDIQTTTTQTTGQTVVPIEAGENHIQIFFKMGRDRSLGIAVSISALIILVVCSASAKRTVSSPA